MKAKITAFLDGLITQDYILFGSAFALFILFIILGILLRRKLGLAIFMILLGFSVLFVAPTLGYVKMHEYLFKNSVELVSQKKLNFTKAVVIKGKITNNSKVNFKSCTITANALKVSRKKLKTYLYRFKPFMKMSIVEQDIAKGQTRSFKMILEPFTYGKDFNISLGAKCR